MSEPALVTREQALARLEARYAAQPREIDEALAQLARGDRGCAWLAVSGAGVLATAVVAVSSLKGWVSFQWAYAGLAVWIGGTVMGARAQSASEKHRRAAISSAPLVRARVVLCDPYLRAEGRRAGRGLVVFSLERPVERTLAERTRTIEHTELSMVRADRFAPGPRPASEFGLTDDPSIFLGWIMIDPLRLPGHRLEDPHETLLLLADVDRGVIEHL